MTDCSIRQKDKRVSQTGKTVAQKERNCNGSNFHSEDSTRRLNSLSVERSNLKLNSNRFTELKTEDYFSLYNILDSGASELAVNSESVLSCIEEIPPIWTELANACTVKASRRAIDEVKVAENVPFSCKPYLIPKLKLIISCFSRMDDYEVTVTYEEGTCILTGCRENGRVFGYIRRRNGNGVSAATLRVPQTGKKLIC